VKGLAPILLIAAVFIVIYLYASQTGGAPETGGLGDAAQDALPDSPGDAADKVADGARGAADKGANDIAPWIAQNGPVVAAGVLGMVAIMFYRRNKILSIVIGTAVVVGLLVVIAT
jgi:hypothetical protein